MDKLSNIIRDKLNSLPSLPGIYKMLDSNGTIIYVGKSICLRNRVRSYFSGTHKWRKVEKMVRLIEDIEYEVTDTHLEARLEECRLIKELKPMFNSQMKNDGRYVYLKVEDYNIHKSLSVIHRKENNSYGPFRGKYRLLELIHSLRNIYPIIKGESGYKFSYNVMPVVMDKTMFNKNKDCLIEIFSNDKNITVFLDALDSQMKKAAEHLHFETATTYRNIIYSLNLLNGGINAYKSLYFKNILLKIEIPTGDKLFYVNKGEILLMESYPKLSDRDIIDFINRGKHKTSGSNSLNERKSMDFIGILYSEIKSLPEEMVKVLD